MIDDGQLFGCLRLKFVYSIVYLNQLFEFKLIRGCESN
jgi:hypothetical protein